MMLPQSFWGFGFGWVFSFFTVYKIRIYIYRDLGYNLYCMYVQFSQPKPKLLPSVCMWARGTMSMGRSRAGEVGESSSHTEHGQSVYLALCSVGTPSSRLFHGPPYLSHALLLLPLPPPVRMLSLGSLQAHTHIYTHTSLPAHGWVHPRATGECWYRHWATG